MDPIRQILSNLLAEAEVDLAARLVWTGRIGGRRAYCYDGKGHTAHPVDPNAARRGAAQLQRRAERDATRLLGYTPGHCEMFLT